VVGPLASDATARYGEFHAGTADNIIPQEAHLKGTLRTLTPEVREQAVCRIEEMVKSLDMAFGVSTSIENIFENSLQLYKSRNVNDGRHHWRHRINRSTGLFLVSGPFSPCASFVMSFH
jgi:metal-dependent amidase/aminoacylase/carboxypeptidase family protein